MFVRSCCITHICIYSMISFAADDVYFKQHFCTCNELTPDKKFNAK